MRSQRVGHERLSTAQQGGWLISKICKQLIQLNIVFARFPLLLVLTRETGPGPDGESMHNEPVYMGSGQQNGGIKITPRKMF